MLCPSSRHSRHPPVTGQPPTGSTGPRVGVDADAGVGVGGRIIGRSPDTLAVDRHG